MNIANGGTMLKRKHSSVSSNVDRPTNGRHQLHQFGEAPSSGTSEGKRLCRTSHDQNGTIHARAGDGQSGNHHSLSLTDGSEAAVTEVIIPSGPSKKNSACAACRKQKIRCDIPESGPPCVRCSRRGISCVVNKSIQDILAETQATKLIANDVQNLHMTLQRICRHLQVEDPKPLTSSSGTTRLADHSNGASDGELDEVTCEVSLPASPNAEPAPIERFLEVSKLASPGSIESPNSPSVRRNSQATDLIGKGLISLAIAETLFHRYTTRLGHYLYGIACSYTSLTSLRQASPVLLAAVCTVSALHEPKDHTVFQVCNREFRRLISKSTFEKRDAEYLRALCIGAFWLTDASRIICSEAIRRAADSHMHRNVNLAIQQSNPNQATNVPKDVESMSQAVDKARLWYLLFVCDQHLSILYNRDAILRYDRPMVTNWQLFLARDNVEEADVRIVSQVALLSIMSEGRDSLQEERNEPLPRSANAQIAALCRQLDNWYNVFSPKFQINAQVGEFPIKGLQMHYHFGRLSLCHHVLKGLHDGQIPSYFLSTAGTAHDASVAIFEMILHDEQMQQALVGIPQYFHVMFAFAGHFLLEICSKYAQQLSLDVQVDFKLIEEVLQLFNNLECIPQHPLRSMTVGLGRKLLDCTAGLGSSMPHPTSSQTFATDHQQFQSLANPVGQNSDQSNLPFNVHSVFSNDMYSGLTDPNLLGFGSFNFSNLDMGY